MEDCEKQQVQFTTLWKALQKWYKEKRKQKEGIFREERKKVFTWLWFDESKQILFGTNPSISNNLSNLVSQIYAH